MNIAEFWVNLGVKGSEKTVGALSNVKKGLGEVSSMSLEAKAGILAALYGLEQMTAMSGRAGTGLTNFAALTGLSAQSLQQWQYAARQAGVSSEELTGSLKGVQQGMTNMLLGKGAPEGLAVLANSVGFDAKRARDTFYVMGQMQKAAQSLPADIGNSVLKSMGASEGTIAAMRRNAFSPTAFKNAPHYSDKEIHSLDRANIGWSNLGNHIEMAIGHMNAAHGGKLVSDITKIVDAVLKLSEALIVLSDRLKVFEALGGALNAIANFIKVVNADLNVATGNADKNNKDPLMREAGASLGVLGKLPGRALDSFNSTAGNGNWWIDMVNSGLSSAQSKAMQVHNKNYNINQTITHHGDAKDTKAVKDTHRASVNHAYRQRQQGGST